MFDRIKKLVQKLAPAATAKDLLSGATEVLSSVYPFFLGAILLYLFAARQWVVFGLNLGCAVCIAVMNFLTLRSRRKHIDAASATVKTLMAEHDQIHEFFEFLLAGGQRGGSVEIVLGRDGKDEMRLKLVLRPGQLGDISISPVANVEPEPRPEKMN